LLLAGFTVLYFAATWAVSRHKLLWYDELLTYYLCRLPRFADFWTALATGPDLSPPAYHLSVRGTYALLGEGLTISRLPAAGGVGAVALSLFFSVGRRVPPAFAWSALLFPLTTRAYYYAFEARPYGLVLGCSGLALLCWQAAAEGRRRPLALAGLALSL